MAVIEAPEAYSEYIAKLILNRMANGESLISICREHGYPSQAEVISWIQDVPGFDEKYARARSVQADVLADEILDLSNNCRKGTIITEKTGPATDVDGDEVLIERKVVTQDMVERTKLQIDARKWFASKVAPLKYGDRLAHQMLDEKGKPAKLEITVTRVDPRVDPAP